MPERVTIGCDPAITKKGSAFSVYHGETLIGWKTIPVKHDEGIIDPITRLAFKEFFIEHYQPGAKLYIEGAYLSTKSYISKKTGKRVSCSNPLSYQRLIQVISCITGIAQDLGYAIEEVSNQEWTTAVLRCQPYTPGNARKRLSLTFAKQLTGSDNLTEDEADAIHIGGYGARR